MGKQTTKQLVVDPSYVGNVTGAVAAGDNVTVALGKIVNSIATSGGNVTNASIIAALGYTPANQSALGNMSVQNATSVNITGGTASNLNITSSNFSGNITNGNSTGGTNNNQTTNNEINNNGTLNNVSINGVFKANGNTATAGQALFFNATSVPYFGNVTSINWQSPQSSNFTAVSGNAYPINTTGAPVLVTLPASPISGSNVQITDYAGTASTNGITVTGNGSKIEGATNNVTMSTARGAFSLVYVDATQGWIPVVPVLPVPVVAGSFGYLLVAGGGGAGKDRGGGGGGGGVLAALSQALPAIGSYPVTIGAGGTGGSYTTSYVIATNGSNTTFSTFIALGGGLGAEPASNNAGSGGSGGGGAASANTGAGAGTSGQGYAGGAGYPTNSAGAGGGGGGGGIGSNGTTTSGGNGGIGFLSSITGTATYYGGGGGGGKDNTGGTGGTGGAGGGGNGQVAQGTAPTNGTANTGGGGGGGGGTASVVGAAVAGNGGSGIAIFTYLTGSMVCTGGTITTNGSYTVHTFTTSGTFARTS